MLLSPSERISLLNILPPAEGNALFLRSVRRLRKQISFTEAEIRDWKVTSPQKGAYIWDSDVSQSVEIDMGGTVSTYVKHCLEIADKNGDLHECLIDIFDHFFPPDEVAP